MQIKNEIYKFFVYVTKLLHFLREKKKVPKKKRYLYQKILIFLSFYFFLFIEREIKKEIYKERKKRKFLGFS